MTTITPLPTPPSRQDPANFSNRADDFLGALPLFATEANLVAGEVNVNAATATTQAGIATTQAGIATTQAGIATTKANEAIVAKNEAAALTENYQGSLASDPTMNKTGGALVAGDWYVNSSTGYIRVYDGSIWVQGVSATSGVISVNGNAGELSSEDVVPTMTGNAGKVLKVGVGEASVEWGLANLSQVQEFTTSATWIKPDGITSVLVEVWGAGGGGGGGRLSNGASYPGGGGGGGSYNKKMFSADDLPNSVVVNIGAGGAGGTGGVFNGTGSAGSTGGVSDFGGLVFGYGGGGGTGGQSVAYVGGGGGGQLGSGLQSAGGPPALVGVAATGYQVSGGGGAGSPGAPAQGSVFGGGGGGNSAAVPSMVGGYSIYAGAGGTGGGYSSTSVRSVSLGTSEGYLGNGGEGGQAGVADVNSKSTANCLSYGDSKFFAFSSMQCVIYTSVDGVSWNKTKIPDTSYAPVPTTSDRTKVFYNGTYWMYMFGSKVVRLHNSFTTGWELVSTIPSTMYCMAYNGSIYVAVGQSGKIYTSSDAISWTERTSGTGEDIRSVVFDGVYWFATGGIGVVLRSTDGITWTHLTPTSSQNYGISSNGSGTLVVLTDSTPFAKYSTDGGTSWTNVSTILASSSSSGSIIFNEGIFVGTANNNTLFSSTDGNTWTTATKNTSSVAYGAGTFVINNTETTPTIASYSANGIATNFSDVTGSALYVSAGHGGDGGIACGGGGGGGMYHTTGDGYSAGNGGNGGDGLVRVWVW